MVTTESPQKDSITPYQIVDQVIRICEEQIAVINTFYGIKPDKVILDVYQNMSSDVYEHKALPDIIHQLEKHAKALNAIEPNVFDLDVHIDKLKQVLLPSYQDANKLHVVKGMLERIDTVLALQVQHYYEHLKEKEQLAMAREDTSSERASPAHKHHRKGHTRR